MGNVSAAKEDWSGLTFANGWVIDKKLSCAEYRAIYIENTGDTTKQIKNSHYLCHNEICGIQTYIERTVIQRVINNNSSVLSKCKGCSNGEKAGICHYSVACREKNLTKIPDRTQKITVGSTYGLFTVNKIFSSGNSTNHQQTAEIVCNICGKTRIASVNATLAQEVACDCFRNHSSGEMLIKKYLEENNYLYKAEYTFNGLVGMGGGSLRYDFALINENCDIIALIEYDGEQHFSEPGTYFNLNGQVQIHDDLKNQFAKDNKIPLLRIPYYNITSIPLLLETFISSLQQ